MLVRREVARSLSKPRGGARPSRRDPISRPGRGDVGHHGVRHARGAVADDRVAQRRLVDLQRDGPRRRLRQVHARLSSQSLDVGSVRLDLLPGLALRPRPRLALRGLWGLWRHVSVYCRYGSCYGLRAPTLRARARERFSLIWESGFVFFMASNSAMSMCGRSFLVRLFELVSRLAGERALRDLIRCQAALASIHYKRFTSANVAATIGALTLIPAHIDSGSCALAHRRGLCAMRRGGAMRRVIALLACVARTSALAAPTRTIAEVAQLSDRMARGRRRNQMYFQNALSSCAA